VREDGVAVRGDGAGRKVVGKPGAGRRAEGGHVRERRVLPAGLALVPADAVARRRVIKAGARPAPHELVPQAGDSLGVPGREPAALAGDFEGRHFYELRVHLGLSQIARQKLAEVLSGQGGAVEQADLGAGLPEAARRRPELLPERTGERLLTVETGVERDVDDGRVGGPERVRGLRQAPPPHVLHHRLADDGREGAMEVVGRPARALRHIRNGELPAQVRLDEVDREKDPRQGVLRATVHGTEPTVSPGEVLDRACGLTRLPR